ncbi:amidohydrolase [uncultured Bilophila sp.]|uniref:amidohydrolase n=1 Tax=uncultured Bilophila sp. TaxID=529385 RepID=UPI0026DC44CB|nr:amidohydrolase [uncultured Bilophila sp.]
MAGGSLSFLDEALASASARLTGWRRDLHRFPEAGWTEFRTAALAIARLREWGFTIRMGKAACVPEKRMGVPSPFALAAARERALAEGADPELVARMGEGYTGFWADLDCGPGPSLAFRFDMDCNEVAESGAAEHRPRREGFGSVHPGLMHACGHDGHVAVGLGLAAVLAAIRPHLRGRLRLVFQPAEEGARGALPMTEAGAVDGVDALFGFHIGFRAGESGTLICGTEGFLATTKRDVTFAGAAAHAGAAPEEGRDALLAACAATLNLHAIARSGKGATRIAVGRLEGGEARNVVPASARLAMETRGETTALDAYMVAESERILRAAADMWGCSCAWTTVGSSGGGSSSPELARTVAEVAAEMGGWNALIERDAFGATEDFACLMRRVQDAGGLATYMQVGTERAAGHHSDRFDFDEACLGRALELLARLACRLAGRDG